MVLPLFPEQRVPAGVAYALIIPVGLAERALVLHAAFAHDRTGMRVAGIVAAFEAIAADNVEKIIHDCLQTLCHIALPPPAAADAVADMRLANLIILIDDGDAADGVAVQCDGPL